MHRSQHTQLDYYAKFKSTHGAGSGDGDGGAAVVIASCFSSFFCYFAIELNQPVFQTTLIYSLRFHSPAKEFQHSN